MSMQTKGVTFPTDYRPLDNAVEVRVKKPLGFAVGVLVHECARHIPMYEQEIQCEAHGMSDEGKEIPINTVGRWLFGVPGYSPHIRIASVDDRVVLHYSNFSPKVVHELIQSLKIALEK